MRSRRVSWRTASMVGVLAIRGVTLFAPGVSGASSDYSHAQFPAAT
jgi:hypothetical protein